MRDDSEPWLLQRMSSMTYLNHHHGERENVGFLAVFQLVPNLRRSPPHGEANLIRDGPRGIRVLSDPSEAKIRDAYVIGIFHKDVGLTKHQYGVNEARSNPVPL